MTSAEYDAWIDVAKKSSYEQFAKEVPDGKQLVDDALSVK
jgi:TRAP-type transport system periplasmic protein